MSLNISGYHLMLAKYESWAMIMNLQLLDGWVSFIKTIVYLEYEFSVTQVEEIIVVIKGPLINKQHMLFFYIVLIDINMIIVIFSAQISHTCLPVLFSEETIYTYPWHHVTSFQYILDFPDKHAFARLLFLVYLKLWLSNYVLVLDDG